MPPGLQGPPESADLSVSRAAEAVVGVVAFVTPLFGGGVVSVGVGVGSWSRTAARMLAWDLAIATGIGVWGRGLACLRRAASSRPLWSTARPTQRHWPSSWSWGVGVCGVVVGLRCPCAAADLALRPCDSAARQSPCALPFAVCAVGCPVSRCPSSPPPPVPGRGGGLGGGGGWGGAVVTE